MNENPLYAEIDRLNKELEETRNALLAAQSKLMRLRGLIEGLFLESLPAPAREQILKAMR